jgi:hypothetical protein
MRWVPRMRFIATEPGGEAILGRGRSTKEGQRQDQQQENGGVETKAG